MGRVRDALGELWDVVLGLIPFYHECCYNCQPWEGGPVWLSEQYEIDEVFNETVHDVCELHSVNLGFELEYGGTDTIEALREAEMRCPNCGTDWESSIEIGGEWLVRRGERTDLATFLLTKDYWPYLTHFTKPTGHSTGLEVALKIIADRRIKSSKRNIKGGKEVVCFTECSPLEIHCLMKQGIQENGMRPFEIMEPLGYGDERFEWKRSPHGIALRRTAALKAGALPVIHGDNIIWQCLPETHKFRFQPFDRTTRYSDWTYEREFRFAGDVNLTQFVPEDVLLIVGNRKEHFSVLAQVDVPPCPVIPFDFVFSSDCPYPRRTNRQKAQSW